MWLIVGLGNPGAEYEGHRHNIGFMAADALHARFGFPAWKKKFQGLAAEGKIPGCDETVILLKPQTYMNLSGAAVRAAAQFYKTPPERIVVFHDDLDLGPGRVKIKQGGGAGGHNGLISLDSHLGKDYRRVRLGVGHPGVHLPGKAERVTSHVLSNFAKADKTWLAPLLEALVDGFPEFLKSGAAAYLSSFTRNLSDGRGGGKG